MDFLEYKIGKLINEGKTKRVYELDVLKDGSKVAYEIKDDDGKGTVVMELCLLESKDRITAGDGAKSHDLEGKAEISTSTTIKVFQLLEQAGLRTAYVRPAGPKSFIARKCEMIPIEWVTRRQATGSFLKKHPGVQEGYRFNRPLQETFFKDDANHDPQWCDEQIISANFLLNGLRITKDEVDIMKRTTLAVFEILERAWTVRNCSLIDMKIEFGVDASKKIIVADIIDSDSWRLWPSGDKKLMKDKQVYRDLSNVTQQNLETIKCNFKWVNDQLDYIIQASNPLIVILMGSISDKEHCEKIAAYAKKYGLKPQLRVCSAHKGTEETLNILAEYESSGENVVLIAVAGRSNGLGPVLSGNSVLPVINCPPFESDNVNRSIWSSLDVPSGLGCTTVLRPEGAALAAAQIHAMHNHIVWGRLRVQQLKNFISLKQMDLNFRQCPKI